MKKMSFTHLQVRTGYSFYKSTITIEKLIDQAKELNFTALAITDENVLYGAIHFYKACKKANIKPIIGITTEILINSTGEKEQLILLAKNNAGYQQLLQLSSSIHLKEELLNLHDLKEGNENLIAILPVVSSKLSSLLLEPTHENAQQYMKEWEYTFLANNLFLGITDHGEEKERKLHRSLKAFHETSNLPVVALQDVRYLKADDYTAYDCLLAMKEGRRWSEEAIPNHVKLRHFRSKEEMEGLFNEFWPEVLENSINIAEQCNVNLSLHNPVMPSFAVPNNQDAFTYLKDLCWQGAREKYRVISEEIESRLNYELDVIRRMDFCDYFLIVSDFISYAKRKGIFVGPGRGSSAGSIVAYVLDITEVDPIKHNLLFERFLNPERTTMPDIDIDFSDHRREEVIDYIREKYGKQFVAQIITFGTFGPRSILRELMKTIGVEIEDEQYVFRHIPSGANKPIKSYLVASKELLDYVKQSDKLKTLFSIAHKLEGLPRHSSTHAAGIVISDEPLVNYTPLTKGGKETVLTQYAMDDLEDIGLLKIDLLGLRNLSLIENIVKSIEFHTKETIDIHQLPKDDDQTYKLLQRGQTNGIFQLESTGMKGVLRELKPTTFNDIVAVNALYRPGPMEFIPNYIRRKHNEEKLNYPHEDLVDILRPTYGVLIYQEQIMEITNKIAGLSYGEADLLRRGITTKNEGLMEEQKSKFLKGCLAKGYDSSVAEKIFSWILRFSNYGFPKSHATAYSKISYKLAYLKANYPAYFFAELLSSVMNDKQRVNTYVQEAKALGVEVLPPSINNSVGKYSVQKGKIQIGFLAIKGINLQASQEIVKVRKDGRFKNIFDFCLRISSHIVNKMMMENLILAGAFDETHANRASLLATLDQAIEQGELFKEFINQGSLFEYDLKLQSEYEKIKDFSQVHKLATEKELIGMYVSSHPLKRYRQLLESKGYSTILKMKSKQVNAKAKAAAIIQEVKTIRTRKGESMAFIVFGDETGDINAVVFPREYRKYWKYLEEEKIVFCEGKINERNSQKQIVLESIELFTDEKLDHSHEGTLYIKVKKSLNHVALQEIKKIANKYPGNSPIIIYSEAERKSYKLSNQYHVIPKLNCLEKFKKIFGKEHVIFKK